MEDEIFARFMAKRPFEDGLGIRGPQSPEPMREIQGAEGGYGSYTVGGASDASSLGGGGDSPNNNPIIPKVIIAFNGTLYYVNLFGTIGAKV